ncbi:efflux RND transporter periplasmic adaptor subunit [Ectothiorhodospira variabilis]|uniref:efflux RND transporter periplasmic adaptor subunit n=1 Tax=Ectothiorhodospira variabilis TaxID=505694 RepID=UPI001EFAA6BF|nr:efflux RND transporter periplasmic adaptor subunit [Ectothiorhodospira variabilis]MCG5495426.1 efflux RND transporter periplasmic adaptor subunit [Ectothiorhodospira variabilis]MCG5497763.1 efflux RND transporter periplasmic adaptor subunit [Ectothiorhodospira variabilis]MCG5505024.1 efflux RND transporter periplasmic adaptor subunit [Ectothiorhodospira variabilis]MCG5508181.1 efflux RND transporter periplasmic adaptor subunit [Ectothiorhodospira variabilis]
MTADHHPQSRLTPRSLPAYCVARSPLARWTLPLALLASLVFPACSGDAQDDESAGPGPSSRAVTITYVELEPETVTRTQRALGELRSRNDPRVAAEVSGAVKRLLVNEGDRVRAGDLIAELDEEDYVLRRDQAEADVKRFNARSALQELTVVRYRELHENNHVSSQELDEVEAELDVTREELAASRLALRAAERDLERTRVKAPFDGEIDERLVSEGDYVQTGTALYRLTTSDMLQVRVSFPETLANDLEIGMPLKVSNRAAGVSELDTEISEIRPAISLDGRAIRAIALVENPGGWRSGSSVNVELVLSEREGLTVPRQALVQRPDGDTVYVLDADEETVEARRVEVGQRTADWVEILDGLEAGDKVAVDGAGFLTDGASVNASPQEGDDEQ